MLSSMSPTMPYPWSGPLANDDRTDVLIRLIFTFREYQCNAGEHKVRTPVANPACPTCAIQGWLGDDDRPAHGLAIGPFVRGA